MNIIAVTANDIMTRQMQKGQTMMELADSAFPG